MNNKKPNSLIHETSPYLLQHAYNPVDWHAWNDETMAKAKAENKLILVSIGYSSCHWCHVMEHESFENDSVAEVMNKHFINIKVDREERPDVDQVYMTAVQLITGQGGWPLNAIALPDGRPIWGGTYFRKDDWIKNLEAVAEVFENDPQKVEEYATNLLNGIQQSQALVPAKNDDPFTRDLVDALFVNMSRRFDTQEGGPNRAPKFPLPNNYEFLLNYAVLTGNEKAKEQVELTLDKMARGGIYDQAGGGFARYSVDAFWKVPHFEKMLYDNAQLISLYSKAHQVFKKEEYKQVVEESINFLEREMQGDENQFYSALDADSEGVEGKFYVWNETELKDILGDDLDLFKAYYRIEPKELWEHNYILQRNGSDEDFAADQNVDLAVLQGKVKSWKELLLNERVGRVRPGLDDKALTSWNAMMIRAYADAYVAFENETYLQRAMNTARFIDENMQQEDGSLLHSYKNKHAKIDGFLEDYALLIDGYLSLYEANGDAYWLGKAERLTEFSIENFKDPKSAMFFFTRNDGNALVAKNIEKEDNVIPASNSKMATNLFKLARITGNLKYEEQAVEMLQHMQKDMVRYPEGYTQWGQLLLNITYPFYEVAITGNEAESKMLAMRKNGYYPNVLWAFANEENKVDLFENRFVKDETLIFICQNQACKLPVSDVQEALALLVFE